MNICMSCGKKMIKKKSTSYHYIDCGLKNIYLVGITILRCTNTDCDDEEVVLPNQEQLHELIAQSLAKQSKKLLPEEIRFLRTHLGFSGVDFAKKIGVTPETVSRWEKGSVKMSETTEKLLRVLIIAQTGPFREYEELTDFASKSGRGSVKKYFEIEKNGWMVKAA